MAGASDTIWELEEKTFASLKCLWIFTIQDSRFSKHLPMHECIESTHSIFSAVSGQVLVRVVAILAGNTRNRIGRNISISSDPNT